MTTALEWALRVASSVLFATIAGIVSETRIERRRDLFYAAFNALRRFNDAVEQFKSDL